MRSESAQAEGIPRIPHHQVTQPTFSVLQPRPSIEFCPLLSGIIKGEDEQAPKEASNFESGPISAGSASLLSISSSKGPPVPASANHNFQKHTVVTIRKLARGFHFAQCSSPAEAVAHKMWNIFLSSGLKSKRMLVVLFGSAHLEDEKYKDLLKSCFFGELCSYQQGVVRAAQQLLRERVAAVLTPEAVRQNIDGCRNIRMKEHFYAYIMQFADMLRRGPLLKLRINSSTCQRIAARVETSASLHSSHRMGRRARKQSGVMKGGFSQ